MHNQDINKDINKNEGFSSCKHILKTGKNKGMSCGKFYCLVHFNISDFLDLPLVFRNIVENNKTKFDKFFYKQIRGIFYRCQFVAEIKEEVFRIHCIFLINHVNNETNRNSKYVLYILLYKLLDLHSINIIIKKHNYSWFLEVCNNKITQFINEIDNLDEKTGTDLDAKKYIIENLQINRKYFFKYNNLRFSFTKLKVSIVIKLQLNNLYSKTLENMYKPEGTYIPTIRQHFEESYKNL